MFYRIWNIIVTNRNSATAVRGFPLAAHAVIKQYCYRTYSPAIIGWIISMGKSPECLFCILIKQSQQFIGYTRKLVR